MRVPAVWRTVATTVVITRMGVFAVAWLALGLVNPPPPIASPLRWTEPDRLAPQAREDEFRRTAVRRALAALPVRGDARWNLPVSPGGRHLAGDQPDRIAAGLFPAYPALLRLGTAVTSGTRALALIGLVLTLTAFGCGLTYVYHLAEELAGSASGAGRAAVVLLASYPFAVVFSALYSDALFLLAAAGAVYHLRHGESGVACLWGVLTGLTRADGWLLTIPLAILAHGRGGGDPIGGSRRWRAIDLMAIGSPAVSFGAYIAFVIVATGDTLAWTAGAVWSAPLPVLEGGHSYAPRELLPSSVPFLWINVLALVFAGALAGAIARRLGWAYAALVVVLLTPPVLLGGWMAIGRITATCFPIPIYLASVLSDRGRQVGIAAFAMLQGLVAILFFTWRPIV